MINGVVDCSADDLRAISGHDSVASIYAATPSGEATRLARIALAALIVLDIDPLFIRTELGLTRWDVGLSENHVAQLSPDWWNRVQHLNRLMNERPSRWEPSTFGSAFDVEREARRPGDQRLELRIREPGRHREGQASQDVVERDWHGVVTVVAQLAAEVDEHQRRRGPVGQPEPRQHLAERVARMHRLAGLVPALRQLEAHEDLVEDGMLKTERGLGAFVVSHTPPVRPRRSDATSLIPLIIRIEMYDPGVTDCVAAVLTRDDVQCASAPSVGEHIGPGTLGTDVHELIGMHPTVAKASTT